MVRSLFTSESVTEGHPDKLCDQISDAILDACLKEDEKSRVAVECLAKTGLVVVAGELTTAAHIDIAQIVRGVLEDAGYTDASFGIDAKTCAVLTQVDRQSADIARGVDADGAGDQGLMFGFACDETDEFLPLPIALAHRLAERLATVRKEGIIENLGPDGKTQMTVEYENGRPVRVDAVLVSAQHGEGVGQERLRDALIKEVIVPVCGAWLDGKTRVLTNPTGRFVRGGPHADAGLTGRKIIVDTYGGAGRHGGGAFSGKDATKVDRSGAYAARYIAKNIVAAGLAKKCEVQLAYAIGIAEPVSVRVDSFGTGLLGDDALTGLVRACFPLRPREIIAELGLHRPIFRRTACYGHFGRSEFPWEKLDRVERLKAAALKSAVITV